MLAKRLPDHIGSTDDQPTASIIISSPHTYTFSWTRPRADPVRRRANQRSFVSCANATAAGTGKRNPAPRGRVLRERDLPKMTYPLILDLAADAIPVAVTCRVLDFPTQAFYAWKAQPVSRRDLNDAYLINAARDIHADDPAFGHRFIADELPATASPPASTGWPGSARRRDLVSVREKRGSPAAPGRRCTTTWSANRTDMPHDQRALARAARERATARGETYTAARAALIAEHGTPAATATIDSVLLVPYPDESDVEVDELGWRVLPPDASPQQP